MRAPVHKTRPRRTSKKTVPAEPTTADAPVVGKGRPTHVRNRLIVAVAVVAAAVGAAGAPSLLAASQRLNESQDLVTLAERTEQALALAHSLADERDEVTAYVAAGRKQSEAPNARHGARVDRQVEELRAEDDLPRGLRQDLDGIAALRRTALTGRGGALEIHQAYSAAITELHRLAERLADRMPPRAGSGGHALAELDSAVQQSAAARGLLIAALSVPRTTQPVYDPLTGATTDVDASTPAQRKQRNALSAAAQQAELRAEAALADFHDTAPAATRDSFESTVTGTEVNTAEKYLSRLTDQPTFSAADLATDIKKADAALSARVDLMRGAESALFHERTQRLAQLRDDDVTALEIRVGVLAGLMILTIALTTAVARTLTRPLAVLRRGSARLAEAEDPTAEEPITFTGRNDEFAQVVRSVNALHAHVAAVRERVATLESDRKHLVGQRQRMADAREELRAELDAATARLSALRESIGGTFVSLALRTLGLVERQLQVIEGLEEREQDPERLATLFKLDHFATVMRRHSENLLVLAGSEHVQQHAGPIPLVDVVRAAVSEIERYERVRISSLPPHAHVAGFAADDLSHLLAELMENATSFSPPELPVEVSGWLLESGEIMISVQDEGIGVPPERLERLNARLADFDPEAPFEQEDADGIGLGLYVVARLAHRHGVRVELREQKQGGTAAVVVLPTPLLAPAPSSAVPSAEPVAAAAGSVSLPGADAEANSHVLPGRSGADPLIERAEAVVRERAKAREAAGAAEDAAADSAEDAGTSAQAASAEGASAGTPGVAGPAGAADAQDTDATDPADGGEAAADAPAAAGAQDVHGTDEARETADGAPAADAASPAPEPRDTGAGPAAPEPEARTHTSVETTLELLVPSPGSTRPQGPTAAGTGTAPGLAHPADDAAERPEPEADGRQHPEEGPAGHPAEEAAADAPRPGAAEEPPAPRPDADTTAAPRPDAPEGVGAAETTVVPHPRAAEESDRPRTAPRDGEDAEHTRTPDAPAPDDGTDATRAAGTRTSDTRTAEDERRVPGPRVPAQDADTAHDAEDAEETEEEEQLTDKGLPKRTPRITAPVTPPRPRARGVDAEALRRRLGGFRRGVEAGFRDVEAEIAEKTGQTRKPEEAAETTGGTSEEASC